MVILNYDTRAYNKRKRLYLTSTGLFLQGTWVLSFEIAAYQDMMISAEVERIGL
jgi:hypothetical protein